MMEKMRIREVLVVEGKYDAARLQNLVDGLVLCTGGFNVFTSEETKELILRLGRVRGLCVLTDSDAAGFRIRRYLNDLAQGFSVKNAYIPAVPGKEKRKAKPGKEGLLGVEGVPDEVIITALRRAGVNGQAPRTGRAIDYADLYELGQIGRAHV